MQGGVNCGPMGMSVGLDHALAGAAMAGAMNHPFAEHEGAGVEMWEHDFVMQQHMHQHHHFHHHHHQHHQHQMVPTQHHFDPMQWQAEFSMQQEFLQQGREGGMQQQHALHAPVDDQAMAEVLAAAYENEAAFAEGNAATAVDDWLEQFEGAQQDGQEWADDYNNDEVQTHTLEGEPLRTVAQKDAESKFQGLMNDIQSGEVVIEESAASKTAQPAETPGAAEAWADQFADDPEALALATAWREAGGQGEMTDEFLAEMQRIENRMAEDQQQWADEYDRDGMHDIGDGEDWLKEYHNLTNRMAEVAENTEYPFEANNPYLFHASPFQEGQELLAAGTLSEAVLAFEAACQKDPTVVEHWQFLGTSQAENEKDQLAIIALNAARKLCPGNLHVLSALSVSHTNEANHGMALQYLMEWICANEKYPGLRDAVGEVVVDDFDHDTHFAPQYLFVDPQQHKQVVAMYEAAHVIDPSDVEICKALGVLHNLSSEYDKAAQNFRDALKLAPTDEKLWNKLGATLANGNKPREAIDAYNRALDINPGFVRSQYNMGVAYQSLGDYVQAARQFIRAICMQQGGVTPGTDDGTPNRSTEAIWDILRMTFNLMDKPDLVETTWGHDVRPFLGEFGLHDLM